MKIKFTTPCYVRIDDAQQRKEVCDKLYKSGYKHIWDSNEQFKSIIYADVEDGVVRLLRNANEFGIDCGENIDLFLDLAGMRSDTDKKQFFINDRYKHIGLFTLYKCDKPQFKRYVVEWEDGLANMRDDFRRATAQEIINYHKLIIG